MKDLIAQLKRHEGFAATPYRCRSGVLTWGYGFTEITEDEADMVLRLKVLELRHTLYERLLPLSPTRQAVILNMAYNLGVAGLLGFKRMWAAIDRQDWDTAADEMIDSMWAWQVGARAVELAEQMRRG